MVYQTVPAVGYNSAVVKSDRLGGNFAYSVASNPTTYTYAGVPTVQYAYNNVAYKTPVAYSSVVASPLAYNHVYAAGTPASTYKTVGVAGVSPYYYNNLGYSGVYGYPTVL